MGKMKQLAIDIDEAKREVRDILDKSNDDGVSDVAMQGALSMRWFFLRNEFGDDVAREIIEQATSEWFIDICQRIGMGNP